VTRLSQSDTCNKTASRKSTANTHSNNSTVTDKKPLASSSKPTRVSSNDNVFIAATDNPPESTKSKSSLSDADKVVGSKKPSLKSQSSIGSAIVEEDVEIQIQSETYREPTYGLSQQVSFVVLCAFISLRSKMVTK